MLLDLSTVSRRQAISLTPLIDVVFILLLFFMLSSSFTQWRQVQLSSAVETDLIPEQKDIRRVYLSGEVGMLEVDGKPLNSADAVRLFAWIAEKREAVYVISVADDVTTQAFVTVVDRLKSAGAEQVSLADAQP